MIQLTTPGEYALSLATALESEYPNLREDVAECIEEDERHIAPVVFSSITVARLVWEISKFIWVKKRQVSDISEDRLEKDTFDRFKNQIAVNGDHLLNIVTTALEFARTIVG